MIYSHTQPIIPYINLDNLDIAVLVSSPDSVNSI